MPNHSQMSELADEHGMDLHYGREAMTEHTHHWDLYEPDDREKVFAECLLGWCDAILSKEEIERRLNATERLSGAQAITAAGYIRGRNTAAEALDAYASALEK